ncbi:MAG: glycerophosphodiester phosphodiesterase family protein [Idiomarina sp.]
MHRLLQSLSICLLLVAPVILAQQPTSDEPQTLEAQFGYDVARQAKERAESESKVESAPPGTAFKQQSDTDSSTAKPAEKSAQESESTSEQEQEQEQEQKQEQEGESEPTPEQTTPELKQLPELESETNSEQASEQATEQEPAVVEDDTIIGEPFGPPVPAAKPIKIAHRGAPAYVPEHTAEGVAMAHAFNVDFIEQDVVLTRDSIPVVLHDIRLDHVSNVAKVFPKKIRPDGHFYVMDFSLDELRKLRLNERVVYREAEQPEAEEEEAESAETAATTEAAESADESGEQVAADESKKRKHYYADKVAEPKYPQRFPLQQGRFGIMTLAEQLELIHGLNQSRGKDIGVYIELKSSRWHQQQGYDLMAQVMTVLARHGYDDAPMPTRIFLQSFDPEDLRRWHREFRTRATLVQLIGENSWNEASVDYSSMRTSAGLEATANQAHAIGVWLPHVISGVNEQGEPEYTDLVKNAHKAGLKVHVYTLRADDLPDFAPDYETLRTWLLDAGIDGYFTDAPDL